MQPMALGPLLESIFLSVGQMRRADPVEAEPWPTTALARKARTEHTRTTLEMHHDYSGRSRATGTTATKAPQRQPSRAPSHHWVGLARGTAPPELQQVGTWCDWRTQPTPDRISDAGARGGDHRSTHRFEPGPLAQTVLGVRGPAAKALTVPGSIATSNVVCQAGSLCIIRPGSRDLVAATLLGDTGTMPNSQPLGACAAEPDQS